MILSDDPRREKERKAKADPSATTSTVLSCDPNLAMPKTLAELDNLWNKQFGQLFSQFVKESHSKLSRIPTAYLLRNEREVEKLFR